MNKKRMILSAAFVVILILGLFCYNRQNTYKFTRILLGTVVNITIISGSEAKALKASDQAFMEIERIENLMSPYRDGDIKNINTNAYIKAVKVTEETLNLMLHAQEISGLTNGSFDITFAAISKLWNFKGKNFIPPEKKLLNKLLPGFNYKNISIATTAKTVKFKNRYTKIGLGGIAKGYAIKKGVLAIKDNGIDNAILEAGGDVQVLGDKFGKLWKIGLRHPRNDDLVLSILLKDEDSIASSGDYERYVIYKGKRYHHILDSNTGFPAYTFASVSVISKDPVDADAYATALFVMGKESAVNFLKERQDLKAIFIDSEMHLSASSELKEQVNVFGNEEIEWF
ncbi:MAG: FAD:protein FMN transferase [Spirochaetes bacterium]|nr:FAD:protein FMN transferase [Spirochaetota bacterium]